MTDSASIPCWPAVDPPLTVKHPLHLLDEFLLSLDDTADENNSNDGESGAGGDSGGINDNDTADDDQERYAERLRRQAKKDEVRIRNVLRVADFLYGDSGAARTVLDNALEVLDGGGGAVRCYRAEESGRAVYVVRGSTSGQGGNSSSRRSSRSSDYLCFLNEVGSENEAGCFCPCRSFFERTKADRRAICKHLLAARLGPYLKLGYEEFVVSDQQFAHIIAQHAFMPG